MSLWSSNIAVGLYSARPAVTAVPIGALYFATDAQQTYRNTGAAWTVYDTTPSGAPPGSSPAVSADFAWVNQGSATITDNTYNQVLTGSGTGAGFNLQGRFKSATPPFTLIVHMKAITLNKAIQGYGVAFRASGASTIAGLTCYCNDPLQPPTIASSKFTSATAFSAHYITYGLTQQVEWFKLVDNNSTVRTCSISADGVNWLQIDSETRTDFLTANQVGFYVLSENTLTVNFAPILTVDYWSLT